MEFNKQQAVADVLSQFKDSYIVGILNDYEMAKKILDAIRFDGLSTDEHECSLDEWLSGECPHPSHHYELLEDQGKAGGANAEYRIAH
jgi:HSP90 family molecular chaperone